jgi:hypothetical protein
VTANGTTVTVTVAVAVMPNDVEQALSEYSFAESVNEPVAVPAVTVVPVKVAEPLDTKTQLRVGALKVAPEGIAPADNCT